MQSRSSSSVKIFYPKLNRSEVIGHLRSRVQELQKQLPIVSVVLFGSYAKGTYTVGSDIDILVVYAGPERPEAYALVKRILDLPRLEPHVFTQAEYEQSCQTLESMIKGGVALFVI